MPRQMRHRLRLFWPYGHHCGPLHYAALPIGPPWWGPRLSADEEIEALAEYIQALKDELKAAEDDLKRLEAHLLPDS